MLERDGAREVERKDDKDAREILFDEYRHQRDPSDYGKSGFQDEGVQHTHVAFARSKSNSCFFFFFETK